MLERQSLFQCTIHSNKQLSSKNAWSELKFKGAEAAEDDFIRGKNMQTMIK